MPGELESQLTGRVWRATHLRGLALAIVDRFGCLEIPEARIPRVIKLITMQAARIMVAAMAADIMAEAVTAAADIIDLNMIMWPDHAQQRTRPSRSGCNEL